MRWPASLCLFAAAGLAACHPSLVAPTRVQVAEPAPSSLIPDGCNANLSGPYVHSENPGYRYRGADDGGTLVLTLERTAPAAADGGSAGVELRLTRTPKGFIGEATGAWPRGAQECPVHFPTELTACFDGGLSLRSAATASIDERCHAPTRGPPAAMVEQTLYREGKDGG